ncbi:MAG TPA: DUF892 family protein [Actinomycetota bacterium]|nr:DUF892 family protein [Actinomycetota bacterium]
MAGTARELFEHQLRDVYDAEHRLVDALSDMAARATDADLTRAFEQHREQTQRQIERVERAFATIGAEPGRERCEAIEGLVAELDEFAGRSPTERVLDAYVAAAAAKVEHYEIAAYESLIPLAGKLGLPEAAAALRENLAEEQATATQLATLHARLVDALA